jgi:hypothetical protein
MKMAVTMVEWRVQKLAAPTAVQMERYWVGWKAARSVEL